MQWRFELGLSCSAVLNCEFCHFNVLTSNGSCWHHAICYVAGVHLAC